MTKIHRPIIIALIAVALLIIAYYIKSDVLRIDIFEDRHLLFFKE